MMPTGSSAESGLKPCLYCGDTTAAKTDEHVVQEAFGASSVLSNEVCGPCNTQVFGPLDGHLVRIVRDLLCHSHPDVPNKRMFIAGDHCVTRDEENSVWVSVRLDRRLRPVVFEQMVQLPDGSWHVSMDPSFVGNAVERLNKMAGELAAVRDENISITVVVGTEPPVEAAIVRSAPGTFVVRAADPAQANTLRSDILGGRFAKNTPRQLTEPRAQATASPVVHFQKAIEEAAILRALAKLALNVACHAIGSATARAPVFKPIRAFARSGEGYGDELHVWLANPDEADLFKAASMMCPPNHHAVRLQPLPEGLLAWICLYQRPVATVRLTNEAADGAWWRLALFNYKRGGGRVYGDEHLAPLPGDLEWEKLASAG